MAHHKTNFLLRRPWLFAVPCLGILILAMVFSVARGAAEIPPAVLWDALFHFDPGQTRHLIVRDLRLPRVIASALVGASLAVAGAVMQGITRNPMADSGLMGLNAGAGFALSLCFAFFPGLSYRRIILFSFLGAALGAALVNGIASLRRDGITPMRMVLAGAAVSALLAALSQGIALYFDVAQNIMFWTAGGVAGSDWNQVRILLPWIGGGLLGAAALSRSVSLLSLGEEVARGLGVRTGMVNALGSLFVLILAGASVSVVGAVSFVGLVIPHITRFLAGADYRRIIPFSAVLGALLMVLADLGARTLNPPFETPVGAIIALIGVPFFLYLARRQKRGL
ncbi:MAG: iron ABC transporter permease [Treponema sp.]|jgi:iron complex transport system permease protein|nr:iron ABC transporter permease [Treponema sp.]